MRRGLEVASFPLTARRIDMGNTMRIDMGNTFCALRRPATHFLREAELLHTSSQTPSIGPLGACDEVCSSSCGTGEISLQTIEVLPMCVLKVLPMSMRATHPNPLPLERVRLGPTLHTLPISIAVGATLRFVSEADRPSIAFVSATRGRRIHPLLGGEGGGEGERSSRFFHRLIFPLWR